MNQTLRGKFNMVLRGIILIFVSKTVLQAGNSTRAAVVYALHITPFLALGFVIRGRKYETQGTWTNENGETLAQSLARQDAARGEKFKKATPL